MLLTVASVGSANSGSLFSSLVGVAVVNGKEEVRVEILIIGYGFGG